jgi:hypothetical protein
MLPNAGDGGAKELVVGGATWIGMAGELAGLPLGILNGGGSLDMGKEDSRSTPASLAHA